jgi:hypothetical protein
MRVITHVLRKIDDEKPISLQAATSPAIAELLNNYNEMALVARAGEDYRLVVATAEMYGQDFKRHLCNLPSVDLHRMLDRYLSHFAHCEKGNATRERTQVDTEDDEPEEDEDHSHTETPAQKSKREFNHWLIKCAIVFAIIVVFIAGGVMVAIMGHNHSADAGIFKTILDNTVEVLKILFTIK